MKLFKFNRKGQIKLFESIAVMFIFFLLVAGGFAVYGNFAKYNINQEQSLIESKRAIETAQLVALLPEFICSKEIVKENCFDLYNVKSFASYMNNTAETNDLMYYFDLFHFSTISLEVFDLREKNSSIYPIYDNPLPEYSSKLNLYFPINVYEPVLDIMNFGILTVEVYD